MYTKTNFKKQIEEPFYRESFTLSLTHGTMVLQQVYSAIEEFW